MAYDPVTEMVAGTEQEIFDFATINNLYDLDTDDDDGDETEDDDFEQMEGWDGPISDAEGFETTRSGHSDTNFDRPLQLAEEQGLEDAIAQRDEAIQALVQQNAELQQRADPGRQQREAQQREELMVNIVSNPEGAANFMQAQKGLWDAMSASRVNASMQASHRDHGRHFEQAYEALTSLDPANPQARSLVQSIYNHQDPGQALLDWHATTGGRAPLFMGGSARRGLMPSLNSQTPGSGYRSSRSQTARSSSRSSGWPVGENAGDWDGGGFDRDVEGDIFRAAVR
jgi:hypothetical protein